MKPTAAPAYFPYPHRTMAEVIAEERAERMAAIRRAHTAIRNRKAWEARG